MSTNLFINYDGMVEVPQYSFNMDGLLFIVVFSGVALCETMVFENKVEDFANTPKVEDNIQHLNICDICECKEKEINCTSRHLTHHFENSFWPSIPLELVTFENNSIVHLKQFPNVTISKLIFRHNRISKIDDNAFRKIQNLSQLDLSHNQLTSSILLPTVFTGKRKYAPHEWEALPQLQVLNLGDNNLHTLHQDLFEHIPNVEVLILNGNPLEVIDDSIMKALNNLYHLQELHLVDCNLETLPEYVFDFHKTSLKKLHLNENRFTKIPTALKYATVLEFLNLDENPIQNLDENNAFPNLPELKRLSLCSLPYLTNVGRYVFSELPVMEELYLCDCPRLINIDEDSLVMHNINGAFWPPLKILDLSNNALKYLSANLLGGMWHKLEKLILLNNDWSCDCQNQYLITQLLPMRGKTLMQDDVDKLFCTAPPEHAGKNLTSLSHRILRCLDRYGARPERDAAILVGILIGLLLALPITLTLFFLWRRGFFFFGRQNPASFSRAFYNRTSTNDS
ncbi:Similar to LRRN1: Leucine-rich repeat neuronal protein 1 (Homo sapiens) [Cotesia congregata]|uniref:Similar to LRRN1: Leucine-rich repeat neuronal protein 1 (Homo sapiens) n=1 Tax=Cotesia congregata TaxID=51543 RepID=A0A8J2HLQ8_COTCN|nr:Similar to LRRN1: Leucine-rich repeat neuronal protein 1 (Homo sapiens) [Cotesia congregata]